MTAPACSALLVRTPANGAVSFASLSQHLAAADVPFEIEPLFTTTAPATGRLGAAAGKTWQWHRARPRQKLDGAHAWEIAHQSLRRGLGMAGSEDVFIEPDLLQQWPMPPRAPKGSGLGAAGKKPAFEDQRTDGGRVGVPGVFAWHLGSSFSQLAAARAAAAPGPSDPRVRIVHLDTGYDPAHLSLPAHLRHDLERNFFPDSGDTTARDPGIDGFLDAPGHGTGTLSILAGKAFAWKDAVYDFNNVLGGAPDAEVIPVRVGEGVVQFRTSSVAQGIAYAASLAHDPATQAHVISMSMGGVASAAWADAVNDAYEAGVVFVAAAGNNFAANFLGLEFGVPTRFIVYPARFNRVIAACGVMADRNPYYGLKTGTMQGNWGPSGKMKTAIAAYTPNIAWAKWGSPDLVDMDGQGTSSATPQVAAAAALYWQVHAKELLDPARYPEPWMRVEAVRHALFTAAENPKSGTADQVGRGLLRAADALNVPLPESNRLQKFGREEAIFPFLRALTGLGLTDAGAKSDMFALEATQLAQQPYGEGKKNLFEAVAQDPDQPTITRTHQRQMIEALIEHPAASPQLRAHLDAVRSRQFGGRSGGGPARPAAEGKPPAPAPATPRANPIPYKVPEPPVRSLRAYAIDPSLSTEYKTSAISEVTLHLPWGKIEPGPCDEYIHVMDFDPASGFCYQPVDLNDPNILAQDGLAPSQGTPQFHQQMVYAVARLTIHNFEQALGRRTLWRPGPPPPRTHPKNDSNFVPRLRIYPHALRERNAYYSPEKVALLFGYFNASSDAPGDHLPGGRVFSCLSHDIVAHETTHALLDGMHRRFLRPTNPDVHAFHEAFADLVALLQHFTFPEILRHQISTTRGEIDKQETLLAQLAGEFGRATGQRGALRYAIGKQVDGEWKPHDPAPDEYEKTKEPHARGAILVAAVFDAFVAIYKRRTGDLLRLATGGTGVLRPGAIHPDLVERLAREAAKTAGHVLVMCVRALDYCPPVDITFGEYLRAIITGDFDAVPDDDLDYRVAFIESFRRRGIYPRNLRTLSEESLLWRDSDEDAQQPSATLAAGLALLRNNADAQLYAHSREDLFHQQRAMRRQLHDWLAEHLTTAQGRGDADFLGLDPGSNFEVNFARFAYRVGPDGGMTPQLLVGLLQDKRVPVLPSDPDGEQILVEGGCTIVADMRKASIGYCIRKSITSTARLERQREFAVAARETRRSTYLGAPSLEGEKAPFAALHRCCH